MSISLLFFFFIKQSDCGHSANDKTESRCSYFKSYAVAYGYLYINLH